MPEIPFHPLLDALGKQRHVLDSRRDADALPMGVGVAAVSDVQILKRWLQTHVLKHALQSVARVQAEIFQACHQALLVLPGMQVALIGSLHVSLFRRHPLLIPSLNVFGFALGTPEIRPGDGPWILHHRDDGRLRDLGDGGQIGDVTRRLVEADHWQLAFEDACVLEDAVVELCKAIGGAGCAQVGLLNLPATHHVAVKRLLAWKIPWCAAE